MLRSILLALAMVLPAFAGKLPYTYIRVGNAADVSPATTPGIVLMGGGTDVDAAFQWMSARSGNGDFLVIRATGTDAYNPYIQALCPAANSVATLIIPSLAAANDARVAAIINQAEAIWIAGGDQSNYINFWKNTPVQAALNGALNRGVPIGGTSAGLNVLTQFVYSALAAQGVTSSQALADPFNKYMSFDRDFVNLPLLAGAIGDPHFTTRDRMGRLLAFMARMATASGSRFRGIAVDEATALLVDTPRGTASLVGAGAAFFLKAPGTAEVCVAKTPLTYLHVGVQRIRAGGTFDLAAWTATGGVAYEISATAGVLSSTQAGGGIY
ncbi:MAG TPA: cyanophycinase [Holophaga sp.]|nr:cyanophycinase [Holophaga sp.]